MKKFIILFIAGIIIGISCTVYAELKYEATEFSYNTKVRTAQENNLQETFDELMENYMGIGHSVVTQVSRSTTSNTKSITIPYNSEYKFYVVVSLYWNRSQTIYTTIKNYTTLNTATNATFLKVGDAGRNGSASSGSSQTYIVIPDGSKNNITLSYTNLESYSVYGIK